MPVTQTESGSGFPVNIGALLAAKNPVLASRIPRFLIRYLERIIHQDEINRFCAEHADEDGPTFVDEAIRYIGVRIDVEGLERLPTTGRLTVCANHPTGGIDGLALMQILFRTRGGVLVPANDLLSSLPNLGIFFVPVDKHGTNSDRISAYEEMFASDSPLLIFPAGVTARPRRGALVDRPWSRSFLRKSRVHGRTLVPVGIQARNSAFFYGLWRLRTFLGIRANLEMLYLVDELKKQAGKVVRVRIGEPIEPEDIPVEDPSGPDRLSALSHILAWSNP